MSSFILRSWAAGLAVVVLAVNGAACKGASSAAAPAKAPSANAWAVVDGREITRDDVDKAFRRAQQGPVPSDEETLAAKLSLLDELITQDILLAKARELKLEVAPTEVESAFAAGRKNIPDQAFQQELARRQLTADDMREGLRRELLAQKVLEREVTQKATVGDQDVAAFYDANKAQFNLTEDAWHVAQIVVTPDRDPNVNNRTGDDAATPEQAARKAQMLMERLKSGVPFSDLARDYSEDPQTAPRGGDLGFLPMSALRQAPPALRDAVLKSQPGTVSGVSAGGMHSLVLVVEKEAAGQRDLAAVRDRIQANLKGRKEQLLRTAYLSAVRSEAKVQNIVARQVLEGQGALPSAVMPKPPGAK